MGHARRSRRRTVAFTIANQRLAANAKVLLEDVGRVQPTWARATIAAGALDARTTRRGPDVSTLTPRDLAMPEALAFAATLPEPAALAAMVPWAFEALFARGYERVVFLGPMVRCYSPVQELDRALASHDAVLIPRVSQPFTDSLTPGMRELREAGHFDPALIGLAPTAATRSLVRWWMDAWRNRWLRPDRERPLDPSVAALEMIPVAVDRAAVLRDPAYQVGVWNLHGREMTFDARAHAWTLLSGGPLRTVNFEGLTGALATGSRLQPDAWPTWLRQLVGEYADRLGQRRGARSAQPSHALDRLLPIPSTWRAEVLDAPEVKGALLTAASSAAVRRILQEYLRLPDSDFPELPRLLVEAYRQLPDLQRSTRGASAAGVRERLLRWHAADQGRTCGLPLDVNGWPARARRARRAAVNVFGYFTSQSGLAEAARSTMRALSPPAADCRAVNYLGGSPSPFAAPGVPLSLPHARPALDIVHVNCNAAPLFHATHGEVWARDSYKIGYWLWELETLPANAEEHASLFDEIWCASEFNRACFQQLGTVPVRLAPLLVGPDLARMARAGQQRPSVSRLSGRPHVFVTLGDFFSCPERKNPLAAIEAYRAAFPRDNGATGLIVKVSNTGIRPDYLESLRQAARGRRDIEFLLDNLDAAELAALIARSAALVSLHTTEGYGLPIAEALALGRPVIATGYGGNVDFCQRPEAHVVGYEMVTLERQLGPYGPGTRWASPNLEEAARAFQQIYRLRRRTSDAFRPRVAEFNRTAGRLCRQALDAAVERAALGPGVQFATERLKVAIFGAGAGGERLARQLLRRHDVVCFLDNDREKSGSTLLGLPIVSPDRVLDLTVDKIVVGSIYEAQIRAQLIALGVSPDRLSLHSIPGAAHRAASTAA